MLGAAWANFCRFFFFFANHQILQVGKWETLYDLAWSKFDQISSIHLEINQYNN